MLPAMALMIAVYGTARLLNDGLDRHPKNAAATAFTWIVSAAAIVGLWILAILINLQGISVPRL